MHLTQGNQAAAKRNGRPVTGVPTPARAIPRKSAEDEDRDARIVRAVARAKQGDAEGIHVLYVSLAPSVQRYVRGIVRDEHEAEDITQQVFAKLMTVIGRYEERGLPFAAWILRVARNVALDHIRASRGVYCDEMQERPGPGGLSESEHECRQSLRDALRSLPDDQAKVVWLRHVVGLSPPEIAEQLGRSESSIHGLHHRGRGALRDALTVLESGPSIRRLRTTANPVKALPKAA